MAKFSVFIEKKAQKQLNHLPEKLQKRLCGAIDVLNEEGFSKNLDIMKLHGLKNTYRVRVGRYRILFDLSDSQIIIYAILPRNDAYK